MGKDSTSIGSNIYTGSNENTQPSDSTSTSNNNSNFKDHANRT